MSEFLVLGFLAWISMAAIVHGYVKTINTRLLEVEERMAKDLRELRNEVRSCLEKLEEQHQWSEEQYRSPINLLRAHNINFLGEQGDGIALTGQGNQ